MHRVHAICTQAIIAITFYIMSSTWQTIHRVYNLYLFTIFHLINGKGRVVGWFVNILASALLRIPPVKFSSLAPLHTPFLAQSLLRSLPPSRRPCIVLSLPRSFPSSTLPPSTLPPSTLPSSTGTLCPPCFLSTSPCTLPPPPSPPSLPHLVQPHSPTLPCSLPPILLPSSLLACPLLACLPPAVQLNVHRVCVFATLHCVVQHLAMHDTKTMDSHSNSRRCFSGGAKATAGFVSAGRCYLQPSDISNWSAHSAYIYNWIGGISNSITDISNSIGYISKYSHFGYISNSIEDISAFQLEISPNRQYLEISPIELKISPMQLLISPNMPIWRYLQFNWKYLQFNWRYLEINSVNKCENGTRRFHIYSLNCRYLQLNWR